IGDGVNDVLPIKKADLGIAMGEGSAAAKAVSSLVLARNDFAALPEAIAEGRTIVRNLRRAGKLFLTKNVYSLAFLAAYAVGLFDLPFPYLPQQVSLLNWMVIGIPAVLLALTRERSAAPDRTPFLVDVGGFALRTGLVFAGAGLTVLALSKHAWGLDEPAQRTMLLTALIGLGVTVLWRVLDGDQQKLTTDRWLRLLSLVVVPIYAGFMYWPFAADFFRLTPLGWLEWGRVLGVGAVAYLASRLTDRIDWSTLGRRVTWLWGRP
ncbi:MAG: cation transporting ATPase C-terminal domain-containing protein, partial [Gemmataceae bacterium]|nr:cation transporting ATPase C-terminal domain-containing protein [Gemmataceae bacterium]